MRYVLSFLILSSSGPLQQNLQTDSLADCNAKRLELQKLYYAQGGTGIFKAECVAVKADAWTAKVKTAK